MKTTFAALILGLALATSAQADSTAVAGSSSDAQAGSSSGANAAITLNSISNQVRQSYPASSAASLLIQTCQDGGSASSINRGLSFGTDSAQCAAIRQASVHIELYDRYYAAGMKEQAQKQWNLAMGYIEKADQAANVGHHPKLVGGTITSLLPVALLFVLF